MTHLGATFKINGPDTHLRIIVSASDPISSEVVVCNVTDFDHDPECACVIEPGEHPMIVKRSVIALRRLKLLNKEAIVAAMQNGSIVQYQDFSAELVARIREAILRSRDVAPKFKRRIIGG